MITKKLRHSIALLLLCASLAPGQPSLAAGVSEPLFETLATRFVLTETAEGAKIGEFVLGRPIRTSEDLRAFLTRLEREQFSKLAEDLEARVRGINGDVPAEGTVPDEARAILLRDAAARALTFNVNPRGQLEFIDLQTAHGSLRENSQAFLHPDVEPQFESLHGKMLKVHRIPTELSGSDGMINAREVFGPGESVVLGVSDQGDFSLVVGDRKYAGMILHTPFVTDAPGGVTMRQGLFVRFNNLSEETIGKLREVISEPKQSLTISCVNGACLKLGKAGVHLSGSPELPIFRNTALQRIFEEGFQTASGAAVRYDVFMNSDLSIEDFFMRMKSKDVANQRLLRVASSRNELTPDALMKELDLAENALDDDTRKTLLVLVQRGVPALAVMGVPVVPATGSH